MKFNPIITRIKLNPEQAVLACTCIGGRYVSRASRLIRANLCSRRSVKTAATQYCVARASVDAS